MYSLTLQNSSDTIISSGDRLGQLNFAAPNESDGGASIIVAGGLHVQAEGAFNASSNPTSLVFSTSAADPSGVVPRIKIDQDGNLIPFVDDENTLGSNSLRFKSGHFSEGIILSDNTPSVTTNNLYNTSGTLYFNGSEIGGGGSYTAGSGLLLVGTEFNVYGGSGHFVNLNVEGVLSAGRLDTPILFLGQSTIPRIYKDNWGAGSNRIQYDASEHYFQYNYSLTYQYGIMRLSNDGLTMAASDWIGWESTDNDIRSSADTRLYRDGSANIIGQRVGSNPQTYRLYNTYSNLSNFERAKLEWSSGVLNIGTEFGSAGGAATPISLQTSGVDRVRIDTDGDIGIGTITPQSQLEISNDTASDVGVIVRGAAAQSANLQQWQNSSSTVLSYIDNFGNLTASGISTTGVYLYDISPTSTDDTLYNTSGTLYFNGSPYIPLPPSGLENQLLYKVSDSSNELAWIDNYATELRELVKNDTGSGILKGTVVMATGAVGDRIQVAPAVADGSIEGRYMFGVASEDIDDSTEGYVSLVGPLKGISTSGWPVGTVLWIDPSNPGGLTSTQPTSPDLQMSVAIVTNESDNNGRIFVRMWEQQPGLHELHDVNVDTVASGDLIAYDSSDGVWKNIQNPSGNLQVQITQNANDIVAVSGLAGGSSYTAGSGLTLVGSEFNVFGGSGNFVDLTVDNLNLGSRYTEKVTPINIVSSGLTIPLNSGNLFTTDLDSAITSITISGVPSTSGVSIGFSLIFTADGTERTVTWPSGVKWPSASSPTLTSGSGQIDVFSFVSIDQGSTWLGFVGGQNY